VKFCPSCKQHRPLIEFAKNATKKDGLQSSCKSCRVVYGRVRYQKEKERYKERNRKLRLRNQLAIYEYLVDKKCADCPITDPLLLTFDHVRGKKLGNISDMAKQSWGLKAIFDEVAKCEIRCFNCHMKKTRTRFSEALQARKFSGAFPEDLSFQAPYTASSSPG
jgi:hypothetical protein